MPDVHMILPNPQQPFTLENIQSLLQKVRIFNHRIGEYHSHQLSESDTCEVFLVNGTIFFTQQELKANNFKQLDFEMMVTITGRFSPFDEKYSEQLFDSGI